MPTSFPCKAPRPDLWSELSRPGKKVAVSPLFHNRPSALRRQFFVAEGGGEFGEE